MTAAKAAQLRERLASGAEVPPRDERDWVTSAELQFEARITYRQLDYWCRTGLLAAVGDDSTPGSGYARRFDHYQVARALALHDLLDAGMTLQVCRQVVDQVLAAGRVDLGPVTLLHRRAIEAPRRPASELDHHLEEPLGATP